MFNFFPQLSPPSHEKSTFRVDHNPSSDLPPPPLLPMSGVPSSMGCSGYASVVGTIYGCVGVAVGCLIVAKPSLCHLLLLGEPKASSDKAELAVNQAVCREMDIVFIN